MKNFLIIIVATLLLAGCFSSSGLDETVSEISNTVQLGEIDDTFVALSEAFARQLSLSSFEFGDFATTPDFLNLISVEAAGDTAKVEILKDGTPFLTVFELQLPFGVSYDEIISQLQSSSGIDLQGADFGLDSFYFLGDNLTTNILPLGGSVLAFQFDPQNLEGVREFISSLLILR